MPKVNDIISLFNDKLKAGAFSGHVFQQGKFYGLATPYPIKEGDKDVGMEIAVVGLDGETKDVSIDDTYPFQMYHRILNVGYVPGTSTTNYNMVAVVYANKKRLRKHESDLAFMIKSEMEKRFSLTDLGTSGISAVAAYFTAANFDSNQVFNQEYKANGYIQDPEKIYFAMTYTLSVDASPGCVTCSECE